MKERCRLDGADRQEVKDELVRVGQAQMFFRGHIPWDRPWDEPMVAPEGRYRMMLTFLDEVERAHNRMLACRCSGCTESAR